MSTTKAEGMSALMTLVIVFSITAALALTVFMGFPTRKARQKWEYALWNAPDTELASKFETAGKDGWEIVSCRRALVDRQGAYECIMKRPTL